MSQEPSRVPLVVRCTACGHAWAVAYLPMEANKAAKAMGALGKYCPSCAAPKPVMASAEVSARFPLLHQTPCPPR